MTIGLALFNTMGSTLNTENIMEASPRGKLHTTGGIQHWVLPIIPSAFSISACSVEQWTSHLCPQSQFGGGGLTRAKEGGQYHCGSCLLLAHLLSSIQPHSHDFMNLYLTYLYHKHHFSLILLHDWTKKICNGYWYELHGCSVLHSHIVI